MWKELARGVLEPPAFVPCVNLGSSVPWEGKNSKEQQGAGDACETDRNGGMVSSNSLPFA